MRFEYHQYPYDNDNYGVLIHDPATGETAAVDAGDASALLAALDAKGWTLNTLWITHHHGDHTAGTMTVKEATGCTVLGPKPLSRPIAGLDEQFGDGDHFTFGGSRVEVIATPGHTLDMINFYLPDEGVIFTGDTLFVMGCGRLFEGSQAQMFESLNRLAALPANTVVYCSHEYTLANAAFALSVDPANADLIARVEKVNQLRAADKPTVPTSIAEELATNPFLRAGSSGIRQALDMHDSTDLEMFTKVRALKDNA